MKDPMEVCPLSRGAFTPIRLITNRPSLSPFSSTRTFFRSPYGSPALSLGKIRAYHVPLTYLIDGLGAVYSPVALHLRGRNEKSLSLATCLLAQAYVSLWETPAPLACHLLRRLSTVHICSPYHPSSLPTTLALVVATSSHDLIAILSDEATLSPSLFIQTGRIPMAEHWVTACFFQL